MAFNWTPIEDFTIRGAWGSNFRAPVFGEISPTNNYLRNIGFQVVIQNIADKHAPYAYRTQAQGGQPCTCDISKSLYGRQVSLIITKNW